MNKLYSIWLLCMPLLHVSAGNHLPAMGNGLTQVLGVNVKDTIVEDEIAKEDELIEEVIKSRTAPKKEKVQYFNQVTKYGFKNLFSNYSYNSTLPYNAQVNPQAEIFVQDYMKVHGIYLQKMKGWGQPYFNLIESVLQQYGLPRELKYIAVIESNLSTGATSYAGAGGPWQFMPYTARDYGLVVNGYLDERRDYYKSTHAAARYLLSLYREMHDWLLVMAAYNGGPGRVYSAMKKSGSKDFWDLQYYLPAESRTYVKRFIATHYIMEGSGGVTTTGGSLLYGYDFSGTENNGRTNYGNTRDKQHPYKTKAALTAEELVEVEVLSISGKYNSLVIAKTIAMDIALFNHFNPNFDGTMSSTGNFDLRLPPDKMQLFVANKYPILNESIQVLLNGAVVPVNKMVYPKVKEKKKS
ncbi:MAG: lytic transglycosylase domain-containing protein [Ferruginibacter sp.]|nr:lytic transglycosylase domain-containing protein [Ferruginibacter sp.]